MPDLLAEIVAHKRLEIERAKAVRPAAELEKKLASAPPVRGFVAALEAKPPVALIAEVKKSSPSAGLMTGRYDPVETAREYERAGAACVSVLTDEKYFHGHLE